MRLLGGDYLFTLVANCPPLSVAVDMAGIVVDEWTRRRAVTMAEDVIRMACEVSPRPAVELVSHICRAASELETEAGVSEAGFQTAQDAAGSILARMIENHKTGRRLGKLCGLRCIDYRMGGFHPGELIVVGGRPSMGKTAVARAMAHGCAGRNPSDQVLFFDIEMGADRMMQRELSALSHSLGESVAYSDMAAGNLAPQDFAALHRARALVPENLILIDNSSIGIDDIRRAVWTRRRKGTIALVVIDYLQILRRPDSRGRNDTAVLGEITAALKRLARQAGCAIVLLSQLSRQVESREDKRPMLSDLRESGSIEQDADFVMFPFREVYYAEREKPKPGKEMEHDMRLMDLAHVMEVITAKARRTSVGVDRQTYVPEFDHISDEVRA